ncbi:MAG TPA: cyclopropane-fatty-acyl-phospholipid synthase family protein [Terriglobales bacterium]|nr:cyclopropane-fatty-acyl-phospholipid synthase family protein [Terriglobales bacterium]
MGLLAKSELRHNPVSVSIDFLEHLFVDSRARNFRVRFWDGNYWGASSTSRFTLVLNHPGALRAMFMSPSELSIGEAYIYQDFDVEGDLEAAFELSDYLLSQERGLAQRLHLGTLLGRLPVQSRPRLLPHLHGTAHSKRRDREAVTFHYDLPCELFATFLDRRMVYSCAYFHSQQDDLQTAQEQKLDYICRKLRLRPGDRLLDIGCGWGGLIIHAATHYGAECLGITLSEPQADVARQRIREAEISERCAVEVCDYRDLRPQRQFDKMASVGMFEHVGEARLPDYFQRAWQLLLPGGVFLNHGIARSAMYRAAKPSFTDIYVFPDGELVPINTTLRIAEDAGFEVRDLESLREHYVLTLHHWLKRLEENWQAARQVVNETTFRIWKLYIAGSAHWFRTAKLNLYQALLCKPDHGASGLPLTRADWYQN